MVASKTHRKNRKNFPAAEFLRYLRLFLGHAGAMHSAPLQTEQVKAPQHRGFRDERFASDFLGVAVETLRSWRKQGRGPRFRKIGRCVRYSLRDLAQFIDSLPVGGGQ